MAKRHRKTMLDERAAAPLPLRRQLEILDEESERAFDRILALAGEVFETAKCGILLHENHRFWIKLNGRKMSADAVPDDRSFFQHTVNVDGDIFFVPDTLADPRFRDHPRVAGPPRIRFYCGVPLMGADGKRIGALAVMDGKPHDAPSLLQRRLLGHFAGEVMARIQSRATEYAGELLRSSETRLHRSETQMAQAQRLAQVGSGETDFTTDKHYWSDQMFRIFGLPLGSRTPPAEEIIRDFVHPEDRAAIAENHQRLLRGEAVPRFEYRIVRPDGEERVLMRFGEIVFDDLGRPLRHLVAVQDVTDLRQAEKARDEYLQQLHHAQRLDALGTLAGGIAHDLNNTLVPILALTKLMRADAATDDQRRNFDVVLHAGARARDLVRQVLAFSRKTPVEHHRIELGAIVSDSLGLLRAGIDSRIVLSEKLAASATVFADPGQVHQVVVNLVTNAAQAIGDGPGTISVTVEPMSRGEAIRLTVADDGAGMDERTLSRMFEPFFTTRAVGGGAGLGLAIVHGIVTGHGGSIAAKSIPGKGTRITIDLPSYERRSSTALAMAAA